MNDRSTSSLDDLRQQHPELGFAIYAMEPGGAVTFEVHTPDGDMFSWCGPTAASAIEQAFPPGSDTTDEPADIFA